MGKLIDALYYLVVTAIIGGFVVQGALKLTPTLEQTFGLAAARVPHSWALPLAIIGLLTLNLLLERILPLRALSEAHWVYTARPARRMPGAVGAGRRGCGPRRGGAGHVVAVCGDRGAVPIHDGDA